jgi:hypothetical protein
MMILKWKEGWESSGGTFARAFSGYPGGNNRTALDMEAKSGISFWPGRTHDLSKMLRV